MRRSYRTSSSRARARTATVLLIAGWLLAPFAAASREPTAIGPLDPGTLQPVRIPTASPATPGPDPGPTASPAVSPAVVTDPRVGVRTPPKRLTRPAAGAGAARGDATWYCEPGRSRCPAGYRGGLYAAAGPTLRQGDWRGRHVVVEWHGRTVRVQLVDWCACGNGRVIDLFGDAFTKLAGDGKDDDGLWRGVLRGATVRW